MSSKEVTATSAAVTLTKSDHGIPISNCSNCINRINIILAQAKKEKEIQV